MKNKKTSENIPFIPSYVLQEIIPLLEQASISLKKHNEDKELIRQIDYIRSLLIQRLLRRG